MCLFRCGLYGKITKQLKYISNLIYPFFHNVRPESNLFLEKALAGVPDVLDGML